MTNLLAQEQKLFEKRRRELIQSAIEKFALVHGEEFVGVFDSYEEAAAEGYGRFGNVPFLIKEILEEDPIHFVG